MAQINQAPLCLNSTPYSINLRVSTQLLLRSILVDHWQMYQMAWSKSDQKNRTNSVIRINDSLVQCIVLAMKNNLHNAFISNIM